MNNCKYYFHGYTNTGVKCWWIIDDVCLNYFFNKQYKVNINTEDKESLSVLKSDLSIQGIERVPFKINIWLDDTRTSPFGWYRAHTFNECVFLLNKHKSNVSSISLDHDLGNDTLFGNGYNVLLYLEELSFNNKWDYVPDVITIHTQNNVGRQRMIASLHSIANHWNKHFNKQIAIKESSLTLRM